VGDGGLKGSGEEEEAGDEEGGDEEDVEDVDGKADLSEAREGVRLRDDEEGEAAGGHGEGVPGPGEVPEALAEGGFVAGSCIVV